MSTYKKIFKGKQVATILQFDKNGQLCDMQPRIGDILNQHRGQTRLCVKQIIEKVLNS
jgi:hypothetical protein